MVVVDNREVATGANRLVQLLRTQHDVDAVVTSLQCCDYAVGWRYVRSGMKRSPGFKFVATGGSFDRLRKIVSRCVVLF